MPTLFPLPQALFLLLHLQWHCLLAALHLISLLEFLPPVPSAHSLGSVLQMLTLTLPLIFVRPAPLLLVLSLISVLPTLLLILLPKFVLLIFLLPLLLAFVLLALPLILALESALLVLPLIPALKSALLALLLTLPRISDYLALLPTPTPQFFPAPNLHLLHYLTMLSSHFPAFGLIHLGQDLVSPPPTNPSIFQSHFSAVPLKSQSLLLHDSAVLPFLHNTALLPDPTPS